MSPFAEGRCGDCGNVTLERPVWLALSRTARRAATRAGRRRYGGRGLCSACYTRAKRAGGPLPPKARQVSDHASRCTRCGVTGRLADLTICQDCVDVVRDLDELADWVPPTDDPVDDEPLLISA